MTICLDIRLLKLCQNKAGTFSHLLPAWCSRDGAYSVGKRGKKWGQAPAVSAFHSAMKTVPAARLFQSLPPNQAALMTHDPGMGAGGAGLCHFKTLQTHHYTVHLIYQTPHTEHSEPEVLTCLAPAIRAMFWVISMLWEMAAGICMCFWWAL